MKCLLPLLLAMLPFAAQAQTLASVELGALFVEDSIKGMADVCKRRFPETQESWSAAFENWRGRNQANLDKLHDFAVRLEKRYEQQANDDPFSRFPSPLLSLYLQSAMLPIGSLAAANDNEARSMCGGVQAQLTTDQMNIANIDKVTKTVESILARPRR